jgi:hypothetical protein
MPLYISWYFLPPLSARKTRQPPLVAPPLSGREAVSQQQKALSNHLPVEMLRDNPPYRRHSPPSFAGNTTHGGFKYRLYGTCTGSAPRRPVDRGRLGRPFIAVVLGTHPFEGGLRMACEQAGRQRTLPAPATQQHAVIRGLACYFFPSLR